MMDAVGSILFAFTLAFGAVAEVDQPLLGLSISDHAGSSLSRYKDRTLAEISPYSDRHRWRAYNAIGEVFERLWLKPLGRRVIREGRTSTFQGYPLLQLEDRDEDGIAEFYGYLPPDRSDNTQEFGAFFDLTGDGRPDWIVFYGGALFTKEVKIFYWHHHAVDTNGDGSFDVRIYGAIDTDHDGFPEEEATAWVYDVDHDGLVDKAEHIVRGRAIPITPQRGALPLGYVLTPKFSDQPRVGEAIPTELFKVIADDIQGL